MRSGVLAVAGLLISVLSAAAAQDLPPVVRDVTPPGITPGPPSDGPLVREPAPPPPAQPPRWRRFFLPVTTDAATFVVGSLTIHIAGVSPLTVAATCRLTDGSDWPCGQTALIRFRMFLHGRAVECYFAEPRGDEIVAPCRVGKTDLGTWLLSAGWAGAGESPSAAEVAAATAARCAGVGMWKGTAPPPAEDCRQPHLN